VLEHNGTKIAQSHAIQRYIANACGLLGRTPLEAAVIDAAEEQIRDVADAWQPTNRLPEAEKGPAQKKFISELGHKLAALEKQLRRNNKGSGYLVGDSISLADIYLFRVIEFLSAVDQHLVDEHMPPLLNALTARVASHPRIAAHIKAREARIY
jgi:glutathione S-transferase